MMKCSFEKLQWNLTRSRSTYYYIFGAIFFRRFVSFVRPITECPPFNLTEQFFFVAFRTNPTSLSVAPNCRPAGPFSFEQKQPPAKKYNVKHHLSCNKYISIKSELWWITKTSYVRVYEINSARLRPIIFLFQSNLTFFRPVC